MNTQFLIAFRGCIVVAIVFLRCENFADARPAYKLIINGMTAESEAEKTVQAAIKKDSCNHCHTNYGKRIRLSEFARQFHDSLGGGDKRKFKYCNTFWQKIDGKFSPDAIKTLRDAINAIAKKK